MSATIVHVPPSAGSASQLVQHEPGALWACVGHTAFRTAMIAGGMWVAGCDDRHLWRWALGGALALETILLLWAYQEEQRRQIAPP